MEEQLINFETAKLAKEKGFDVGNHRIRYTESGNFIYDEDGFDPKVYLIATTQSLLQKWLREKYNCIVEVVFQYHKVQTEGKIKFGSTVYYYRCNMSNILTEFADFTSTLFKTYEEALEVGILEALKLIK
jgi:hypothetical protein